MKLWQKGTAALLLLSMILMQTVAFAADKTVEIERKIDRLAAFGIMSKTDVVDESPITRGEMTALVVRASNNVPGEGLGITFEDVPSYHQYGGAIEIAAALGFIDVPADKIFNPDEQISMMEAVVMVTNAMGYAKMALAAGGYPNGYKKMANEQNITKGIKNELLTKEDAVRMISNMMDARAVRLTYQENNPGLTTNASLTYLEDKFEVTKYKVEIQSVDTNRKVVTAKITNGVYTGRVTEYTIGEAVDISTVGGKGTIYVDDNTANRIVYVDLKGGSSGVIIETKEDSGMIYDFISHTNKNEFGTDITVPEWKYVSFTNVDETYKISDEVIVTYEDVTITTEAYNYVGTFCKAVLQDGIIVRMEIYPLSEGGIIYRADEDELRFSVGTKYENYWQGFSNAKDLQIFIDGKTGYKMQDLRSNMVFDYWYGGGNRFIIVASSRVAKGMLTDIDSEYAIIGGAEYRLSEPYGWYSFKHSKLSFVQGDFDDVINKEVTAYIDDNQRIRYIMADIAKDKNPSFNGFVIKAYGDTEDDRHIKIHHADGSGVQTYKVKEKLGRTSLSFEYVQSVQSNLDALGFLQFTLNEDNEISKIEHIEYFGNDIRTKSGMFDHSYKNIEGLYAGDANIYAVMEINGAFTVKHVDYASQLEWAWTGSNGVKVVSDFDLKENPIPDNIVLTRGSEEICDSGTQFDFIESVKWTGEDDIYRIKFLAGYTFDVSEKFVKTHGLKKGCWVRYGERNLGEFRIKVYEVRDYSGDCSEWQTDTYETGKTSGFYKANSVLIRNSDIAQFVVNGVRTDIFMFYDDVNGGSGNMKIYEYQGKNKIVKARDAAGVGATVPWYIRPYQRYPIMNIQDGDDVWFHLKDDGSSVPKIDYIIYQSNNVFFE